MYIFNTFESSCCIQKQQSAYIINHFACIINVWGYAEIFPQAFWQMQMLVVQWFFVTVLVIPVHWYGLRKTKNMESWVSSN